MKIDVNFRHMDRSETLENYVIGKVEDIVSEVMANRSHCHVMVFLVNEYNRNGRGQPTYQCEIEVRYPPKHDVFVHKSDRDIHIAINEATDTLRNLLNENGKREHDWRAHGQRPEVRSEPESQVDEGF